MADLKTKKTTASVEAYLKRIGDPQQRDDALQVLKLMKAVTRKKPQMWGTSIVGFGSYHYKYASGHEGDWFRTGFSPRKGSLTLYIMPGFAGHGELLQRLGKFKLGKSCLYIKQLADVDSATLKELVRASLEQMDKLCHPKSPG